MLYHIKGKFDSSHALIHHEGKCRHLHGHTYKVQAVFEISDDDVFNGGWSNMPIDFARMKGLLDAILSVRDHCLFLSSEGHRQFFGQDSDIKTGVRLSNGDPTAEWLARDIYKALLCDLGRLSANGPTLGLVAVTVWETDTQAVTFMPEDITKARQEVVQSAAGQ